MEQRKESQQNDQRHSSQSKELAQPGDHQTTSGIEPTTGNDSAGGRINTNERSSDTSTKQGVTGSDYDGQVTP